MIKNALDEGWNISFGLVRSPDMHDPFEQMYRLTYMLEKDGERYWRGIKLLALEGFGISKGLEMCLKSISKTIQQVPEIKKANKEKKERIAWHKEHAVNHA